MHQSMPTPEWNGSPKEGGENSVLGGLIVDELQLL